MPTVLRADGFEIRIYTHDHTQRAHVHAWKAGRVVVINLATASKRQVIREIHGMRERDAIAAYRIIAEHGEYLLSHWKEIHGDQGTE